MKNSVSWEKMKPFVWQVTLLLVIGLVTWFVIRPLLKAIQTKLDDNQRFSVIREHRENQLARLPDLESQHALINEHIHKLDIILTKERLVEFIERLESLATVEQVTIEIESRDNAFLESKVTVADKKEGDGKRAALAETQNQPSEGTESPKKNAVSKETGIMSELSLKKYLKLTITVSGQYSNIVSYLHRVETLPYALDITAMNIKAQPETRDALAPESGTLDPFTGLTTPVPLVAAPTNVLDAVFEMVIYLKE